MKSAILQTATRYLLPILLLFSVFLLLRGDYHPGGGFVGGLVASIACVLHSFGNGTEKTMKILRYKPLSLLPIGLAISTAAVTLPLLLDLPAMAGLWLEEALPVVGVIGSSGLVALAVYLVVIGVVLTILFTIALSDEYGITISFEISSMIRAR